LLQELCQRFIKDVITLQEASRQVRDKTSEPRTPRGCPVNTISALLCQVSLN